MSIVLRPGTGLVRVEPRFQRVGGSIPSRRTRRLITPCSSVLQSWSPDSRDVGVTKARLESHLRLRTTAMACVRSESRSRCRGGGSNPDREGSAVDRARQGASLSADHRRGDRSDLRLTTAFGSNRQASCLELVRGHAHLGEERVRILLEPPGRYVEEPSRVL